MEEWKEYKLGDIAEIQTGPFGSQLHKKDYATIGTPIVTVEHLGERNFSTQNLPFVNEKDKERLKQYTLKVGDIVFSRVGSVDRCSYADSSADGWLFSGRCLRVRPHDGINALWLYYYFSRPSLKKYIRNIAVGATMPSLNTKLLSEIPIEVPNFIEQNSITAVLSSLDDKIENNRRINENLEQQAQALFKSWFVDFEPFRDQPFVESELGMIPESLSVEYISDIPHIIETGRRPKGGVNKFTSGVPSVGAEHVKGLGNYDFSKTKFITPEYAETLKTGKINGYELLIYKDGGKPGYFIPNFSIFGEGYPFEKCYLNEHVFKLDFNDKGFNIFCYFFFKTKFIMNYLNAQGAKAAIPGINRQDIERIPIYSPSNERIMKFGEIALPLIKKILVNCKESQKLARTRDMLLPKLMSGEIKV